MVRRFLAAGLFIFLLHLPVFSDEIENRLQTVSLFGSGENLSFTILMTINSPRGIKERTIEAYMQQDESGSNILLQVIEPVFLRKLKFLQKKDKKGRETIWMAASSGVRRISGQNSGERVFDSDFTVEDFSSVNTDTYSFTELPGEAVSNKTMDVILGDLLKPRGAEITRKKLYIDSETDMLMQVDFFSFRGDLVKRYKVIETQIKNGEPFPRICRMDTFGDKSYTILTVEKIDSETAVPANKFNPGSL